MSVITQKVAKMLDMLPEQDQKLAFEIVKKMVLAWDPDFTKSTSDEIEAMQIGIEEIARGEIVRHEDIDWN